MNCDGCYSFVLFNDIEIDNECTYTRGGIIDLLNCPCKKCLIKGMCKDACDNFNKIYNNYQNKGRIFKSRSLFANNMKGVRQ